MCFVKMTILLFGLIQGSSGKTVAINSNPQSNQTKSNVIHPTSGDEGSEEKETPDDQGSSVSASPSPSAPNNKSENLTSTPSSSQTSSTEKERPVTTATTMSDVTAAHMTETPKSTTPSQQHSSAGTERTTSPAVSGQKETSGDKGKLWLQLLIFPVFGALGCVVCVTITACTVNHFKGKLKKCEERREMLEINGEEQGVHTEDATDLSTTKEVEEKKQEVDYAEIDYSKLGSKKEEGNNCKTEDETKVQAENTSEYSEVKFTGKEETPEPENQALPPPITDDQVNDQQPLVDTIIEASEQN